KPALVCVCSRGTCGVCDAIERAGAKPEVKRLVVSSLYPEVSCFTSKIAGGHEQILCNLPLNAQIPRLHVGRIHIVLRRRIERSEQRELSASLAQDVWEGVATRKVTPRVFETTRRSRYCRTERPRR